MVMCCTEACERIIESQRCQLNETPFCHILNNYLKNIEDEPHLISARQATKTATARPCTRAGWSLPVDSSFSMTDTQPINTNNVVPTSSPTHGWNNLSNLFGGLAGGFLASEDIRDVPTSPISIFSSAIGSPARSCCESWRCDTERAARESVHTNMFVPANHADFGV